MRLSFTEPVPSGSDRSRLAKRFRDLATEISRQQPHALTRANGEEGDHAAARFPGNFTKGLKHDAYGLVENPEHYRSFVEAINAPDSTLFEKHVVSAADVFADNLKHGTGETGFRCTFKSTCGDDEEFKPRWRGWESPRAGHVYEMQGPDAGAAGMAPAPRVGSSELAAEMAEVYALAILRDVRFTDIQTGGGDRLCGSEDNPPDAELTASQVVDLLNGMPFFANGTMTEDVCSSTPCNVDINSGLNGFERNRRFARTLSIDGPLTTQSLFRGSTEGAHAGPYISQFMLIGAQSIACAGGGASSFPAKAASWDVQDGFVPYGSLSIDQRTISHRNCLDYMTDWCSWLDVQNGANFKGADEYEDKRRFITTPRDLATYVHFDALYEAYLNACLILLATGAPASKGFPEPSPSSRRDAFATFGGPHILSLVCEVATRCLKAVRRQKFNYHRRARPEALGGRFTLYCLGEGDKLGCTKDAFAKMLSEIPDALLDAVKAHNKAQNNLSRNILCEADCLPDGIEASAFEDCNLLLPMAFPEGSPMHPSYGAGHATVAGGCVTMLKAFFDMFDDCDFGRERPLLAPDGSPISFVPDATGAQLVDWGQGQLTIQGELDKLAANISIGRNMAGVHYYSDYYDSLRMGERIAVGILMEQAPTYGEAVESTFKSFDGDLITLSGVGGSCPSLSVLDRHGTPVSPDGWWLRHVSGAELMEDL